ncbi:MAG: GNAT family N-acetyltransferase [Myxococcota bacterium]
MIHTRDARDEDGPGLRALIEPIFGEYEGVLFLEDEMPELACIATTFASAGGAFYVGTLGPTIVASAGFVPHEGDRVELKKLYVARAHRECGLGGRMLARVESEARRRGAGSVFLWSDAKFLPAHRFYRRRGYVSDGRTRVLADASATVERFFFKTLD